MGLCGKGPLPGVHFCALAPDHDGDCNPTRRMQVGDQVNLGGGVAPASPPYFRAARVDRCANQGCPNRANEGRMAVVTIEARGAKRDVVLILCTPCAEHLGRVIG